MKPVCQSSFGSDRRRGSRRSRTRDQVVRLQNAIHAGFRDELARPVRHLPRQLPRRLPGSASAASTALGDAVPVAACRGLARLEPRGAGRPPGDTPVDVSCAATRHDVCDLPGRRGTHRIRVELEPSEAESGDVARPPKTPIHRGAAVQSSLPCRPRALVASNVPCEMPVGPGFVPRTSQTAIKFTLPDSEMGPKWRR